MRHNRNDHSSNQRGSRQNQGSHFGSQSRNWGQQRDDRNESEFYSASEGRYTELPEHELQGRNSDRWGSSESNNEYRNYNRSGSQTRGGESSYTPATGQYTHYREEDYGINPNRQPQDFSTSRYGQTNRGQINRDFGYGAAGNYSDYYRPSERPTEYGSATRSSSYRSPDSDMDSDSYRSQNFGSDYSNGNSYSEQRQHSNSRFAGRGPKGYTRTDERIREDVCDVLTRHPSIDAAEIECNVKGGEVTLTGTVPERSMKLMAERAICDCQGVKDVTNQIKVQQESSTVGTTKATDKKPTQSKAW